jgi:hypothetical protein
VRIQVSFLLAAAVVALSMGDVLERTAHSATFTVTRTDDPAPDACLPTDCSLREAVIAASTSPSADVIDLPAGTYVLAVPNANPPYTNEDASATGDLDFAGHVAISGEGAETTIVDGNDIDRVFHVLASGSLSIHGITVQNGTVSNQAGAGLFNEGSLLIEHSIITENTHLALECGGGIANWPDAHLTVRDTDITNNMSAQFGGGICNGSGATMLAERVVIRGNAVAAGWIGAGIFNNHAATVRDSLIEGNTASFGSAIWQSGFPVTTMTIERSIIRSNAGPGPAIQSEESSLTIVDSAVRDNAGAGVIAAESLTVESSTISGNAGDGLAVGAGGAKLLRNSTISSNLGTGLRIDDSTVAVNNVTIVQNAAQEGGGVIISNGGTLEASNTVVASNTDTYGGDAPDCSGTITSRGHNLIGSTSGCTIAGDTTGNITGVDPMFGSLANNGGPTMTHAPLLSSAVINAGSPASPGGGGYACELLDQRGALRPQLGRCDIGAFELTDATSDWDDDDVLDVNDNCPAVPNSNQQNTDGDLEGDACDTNDDNDGCSDDEENGALPSLGGLRDQLSQWDFYDVTDNRKIDAVDMGIVRANFNPSGPVPPEDVVYDRRQGVAVWAPGPPDGKINAVDIGLVRASFNHNCQAAP